MVPRLAAAVLGFACVFSAMATGAAMGGDVAVGRQMAGQCAGCHGIDGVAKRPDVPHIGGESDIYLKSQLEAFRSGDRHHEQMSIIAQGLNDEDIGHLIAWYSSIRFSVTLPD